MDVQEDIIIEEPITELSNLLKELVTVHHKHYKSDGNMEASEVLPVLSRISLKMEEMMKSSDTKLKNSSHVILDLRMYDEKLLSFQVCLIYVGLDAEVHNFLASIWDLVHYFLFNK